ncbi:MAG: DHH family phosphoesterase [Candidatus Aenigmatarchaeota archaeon]
MMKRLENLVLQARRAATEIRNFQGVIRVIAHYDADGIASASIIASALSREGKPFRISFVKQLGEKRIKELALEKNLLTIFSDLGSGHINQIQESLIFPGAKVIVLDHHQIKGEVMGNKASSFIHLNPLSFGIGENLSGAGVAYFLAREINPENIELSYLAVVGALGDSQKGSIEENWGLSGANREILKDAKKSGKIVVSTGLRIWGRHSRPIHKAIEYCTDPYIPGISGSESASVQFLNEIGIKIKDGERWRTLSELSVEEQKRLADGIIKERIRGNLADAHEIFGDVYEIPFHPQEFSSAEEFATVLNACGKLGKAYIGLSMCMGNPESFEEAKSLLSAYRKDIGKAISWINQNSYAIKSTEKCVYILAGKQVSEHIVSNLVSMLSRSFLPKEKPVFAFAETEDGNIKVSARAHDTLVENGLSMEAIVSEVACKLGGEGGGHKGAAGATIPRDSQDFFISYVEQLIGNDGNAEKETKGCFSVNIPEVQSNLNIPEQQTLANPLGNGLISHSQTEKSGVFYGTAKAERSEGEGGEKGGSKEGREAPTKKVEGKGLVRYFGAKDVRGNAAG